MINKKTQMYLGVAALGVVAYLVYKNNTKKGFANSGSMLNASGRGGIFAPTGGVSNSTFRRKPCAGGGGITYSNCCFPKDTFASGASSPSIGTSGNLILSNGTLGDPCYMTSTGASMDPKGLY